MSDQLNINELVLDDNSFVLLPDGDYHFTVESHEVGYATSDKLPANTQQIVCKLMIPYMQDGVVEYASVRNNLNIYKKALFAVRQFVECIGMVPEKGQVKIDLEKMDGLSGVCRIVKTEYNGKEYNNVQIFYAPSKAPAVTDNDEAWHKRNDFVNAEESIDDIRALFNES